MKNQKFTHDFLEVVFNLDRHDIATIIPNNIDDIHYFTDNFDNENPLDIYLTTYTDSFLKRIKVNIEDLNPLYKSIVTKHLNNEMTMKRVK